MWQYRFPDQSRRDLGESEFMAVFGDVLVSHCNFVGSNAGDAVKRFGLWVDKWRHTLGLEDVRVLVQAHVHRMAYLEQDGGHRILIEPGAAFEPIAEAYKVGYAAKCRPPA